MSRRHFTDEELLAMLDNSDIEIDIDDEEIAAGWDDSDVEEDIQDENDQNIEEGPISTQRDSTLQATPSTLSAKIKWKTSGNFINRTPDNTLPQVEDVRTPAQYFTKYFTEELFALGAQYTSQYFLANTGKELKTSANEIKQFFGIHAFIGCIKFPRLKMYWSTRFNFQPVTSVMTRDRFFMLRVNLHFVDTVCPPNCPTPNKLWKVQPVIDSVKNRCLEIQRNGNHYSIDEQMIPFLGRCSIRQYVKGKPRPVGLKNFVLAKSDGTVLDFLIYQGNTTPFIDKSLGLGPAVILTLTSTLEKNSCVYFDRYFTTIPLLQKLTESELYGTGTLQANRFKGHTFSSDKTMKRGDCEEVSSQDGNICAVKWKDNRSVLLASNMCGSDPIGHVKRWDMKEKKRVEVQCPAVVKSYNEKMGGVDHCDQLMECYRTWFKTKKWTLKVIIHLFDLAITNSWMEYRHDCRTNKYKKNAILDLLDFRLAVAEYLTCGNPKPQEDEESNSGSDSEDIGPVPKKKRTIATMPGLDKRLDGFNHWPVVDELKDPLCCRQKNCKSRSRVRCTKCNVYLCMIKNRNCFMDFHKK